MGQEDIFPSSHSDMGHMVLDLTLLPAKAYISILYGVFFRIPWRCCHTLCPYFPTDSEEALGVGPEAF
jgi:hypothetical protein